MEDRLMNIGMMATYPPRFESLKATLKTLFPQLDMLFLSPNDYTLDLLHQLQHWIADHAGDCHVRIISGSGNHRDMAKLLALGNEKGYIFLVDDDILYPDNYCQTHIIWIDHHQQISTVMAGLSSSNL